VLLLLKFVIHNPLTLLFCVLFLLPTQVLYAWTLVAPIVLPNRDWS
jgi:hypothetical protein